MNTINDNAIECGREQSSDMLETYDSAWYDDQAKQSYKSARAMLPYIAKLAPSLRGNVKSVIDVGCGVGTWLKAWQETYENISICGVDGNSVNAKHFFIPHEYYQQMDLTMDSSELLSKIKDHFKKNCSLERGAEVATDDDKYTGGGGKPFSIAQSLEVAEHLYPEYAENFIRLLTSLSDIILFSAAIPNQGGTHHVNEKPPAYWAEIFSKYDYVCFDILRKEIWDVEQIACWYRQNVFFYVHKDMKLFEELGYKPEKKPLHLVIPNIYEAKNNQCEYQIKEITKLQNRLNKTFLRRINRLSKKLRGKL